MEIKTPGEERRFFPSFFLLLFLLLLPSLLLPPGPLAREGETEKLSLYDRLAQEATVLNQRGRTEEVIARLGPHRDDPRNESALFFNELGIAYRRQGKLAEASGAYRAALSRDPNNPAIRHNLGTVLYLRKEYAQAAELYEQILRQNPRFAEARSYLGLAYYQLRRYPEALEQFEAVLRLNPKDGQARKFRDEIRKKLNP